MQSTMFAWLPFAMIGVGFLLVLICALGLYLMLGRTGNPNSEIDHAPLVQGHWIDPATGQPVAPPTGYYPLQNPVQPVAGAGNGAASLPAFCHQCGNRYQADHQQFCPRCGARRSG